MIRAECACCKQVVDDFVFTNYHHFPAGIIALCKGCYDKCIKEEKESEERQKQKKKLGWW